MTKCTCFSLFLVLSSTPSLSSNDSSPLFYIFRQQGFAVAWKEDVKVSPEVHYCDGDNM